MAQSATRRRQRRRVAPPPSSQQSLEELAKIAVAAKIASDEADAALLAAKEAVYNKMKAEKRTEYELAADGERPAYGFKETAKTTNTVDPVKFGELVKGKEFFAACSVKVGEAKKLIGETKLKEITSPAKGNPYLEIKAKGRAR